MRGGASGRAPWLSAFLSCETTMKITTNPASLSRGQTGLFPGRSTRRKPVYVLGLNFAYHELAACLIKDGVLLAAVEEERFSRVKHGKKAMVDNPDTLPKEAMAYCLETAGIRLRDVDWVGLSFSPEDRLENINADAFFVDGEWGSESGEKQFYKMIVRVPDLLNKMAGGGFLQKVLWLPHHVCHASSSFFVSPFKESAIMSLDGIGEFSSTWLGMGKGNTIHRIKEIFYPNSLGLLWEKISKFLGFTEYDASKVMGLAAFGHPGRFHESFQTMVKLVPDGGFTVDNDALRFRADDFGPLERIFKLKKRDPRIGIGRNQEDMAAALQKISDDIALHLARFLQKETLSENLCLAGGVALNCVSNGLLAGSGLFKNLYIQPAAHDAGTALGAAYYIWNVALRQKREFVLDHVYWGPKFSGQEIREALAGMNLRCQETSDIAQEVAKRLADGEVVGWFQGRAEWGPRALGNRSLLADPRRPDMKDVLNARIKKREPFRPFAPSILKEYAHEWFILPRDCESLSAEFMLIAVDVRKGRESAIPAVTHVDGTSRIQLVNRETNPLYHELISNFYRLTGVPLVLNTSFNENEPIVCSPQDAVGTFLRTKMDCLAMGDFLISKR